MNDGTPPSPQFDVDTGTDRSKNRKGDKTVRGKIDPNPILVPDPRFNYADVTALHPNNVPDTIKLPDPTPHRSIGLDLQPAIVVKPSAIGGSQVTVTGPRDFVAYKDKSGSLHPVNVHNTVKYTTSKVNRIGFRAGVASSAIDTGNLLLEAYQSGYLDNIDELGSYVQRAVQQIPSQVVEDAVGIMQNRPGTLVRLVGTIIPVLPSLRLAENVYNSVTSSKVHPASDAANAFFDWLDEEAGFDSKISVRAKPNTPAKNIADVPPGGKIYNGKETEENERSGIDTE